MIALSLLPVPNLAGQDRPEETQLEAAAPRIGTFLVGLAAVYDNYGPLDNYFPCPRRGLVIYGGNASGRFVSFQGCDLGGDVVVEGEGTLQWDRAQPGWDALCARSPMPVEGYASVCGKTLSWVGPLTVSVDGGTEAHPNRLNMRIAWQPPVRPRAGVRLESEALDIDTQGIHLVSFEMEADGRVTRVGEEALPRDLFDFATLTLESIPNPSRSIDALSESDQQRIVLDGVLRGLGSLLMDEALEGARGDHEHDVEGCGTSAVTYDSAELRVAHRWTRCSGTPRHGLALVWDGNFTAVLRSPDIRRRIDIVLTGPVVVGGGVPTVEVSRLAVSVEGELSGAVSDSPVEPLRVNGEIVGPRATRPFDYELTFESASP
jgi:hypothetical protein